MSLPSEFLTNPPPLEARLECPALGEWDMQIMTPHLLDLARAAAGRDLRLDLSALEYLGSAALGAFVSLNRRVRANGGRLSLVNLRPAVYQIFELTRLTQVLDVQAAAEG